jgi:hypothetical protein
MSKEMMGELMNSKSGKMMMKEHHINDGEDEEIQK